jgi:Ribbon-helix-helix protein, copG family
MSNRLQVLIPPELDARLLKAARRSRISKGEWVRRAIELSLNSGLRTDSKDSLTRLASLNAPTADIGEVLEEIERGRD